MLPISRLDARGKSHSKTLDESTTVSEPSATVATGLRRLGVRNAKLSESRFDHATRLTQYFGQSRTTT
jgi:hypothetical protein